MKLYEIKSTEEVSLFIKYIEKKGNECSFFIENDKTDFPYFLQYDEYILDYFSFSTDIGDYTLGERRSLTKWNFEEMISKVIPKINIEEDSYTLNNNIKFSSVVDYYNEIDRSDIAEQMMYGEEELSEKLQDDNYIISEMIALQLNLYMLRRTLGVCSDIIDSMRNMISIKRIELEKRNIKMFYICEDF